MAKSITPAEFALKIKACLDVGAIPADISYKDMLLLLKVESLKWYVLNDLVPLFPHWVDDSYMANDIPLCCICSLPTEWIAVVLLYRKLGNRDWQIIIRNQEEDTLDNFFRLVKNHLTEDNIRTFLGSLSKNTILALSQHVDLSNFYLSDAKDIEVMEVLMGIGVQIGDMKILCDNYGAYICEQGFDEDITNQLIQYGIDPAELAKGFHRRSSPFLNVANVLIEMGYGSDLLS